MLGQLSGKKETNCSLDLSAGDGGLLIVVRQSRGLSGNALEDIVNEAVHDGHRLAGNARVGMDLLHDLVDVNSVALLAATSPLLVCPDRTLGVTGFLLSLSTDFGRHGDKSFEIKSTD